MFKDYFMTIAQGIPASLMLTVASLVIAFVLAVGLTFLLSMNNKPISRLINLYLTVFTGTPLLVQFFLIYFGPGQFTWITEGPLWSLLSGVFDTAFLWRSESYFQRAMGKLCSFRVNSLADLKNFDTFRLKTRVTILQ